MARTLAGAMRGTRPGRGASFSSPAKRKARKRCRHSCTVGRESCNSAAMSWLSLPWAARRMIRARCTKRAAIARPRDQASNVVCSSAVKIMADARLLMTSSIGQASL